MEEESSSVGFASFPISVGQILGEDSNQSLSFLLSRVLEGDLVHALR
jgi:hypothetical protein